MTDESPTMSDTNTDENGVEISELETIECPRCGTNHPDPMVICPRCYRDHELQSDLRGLIEEWRDDADERLHPGESALINEIMDELEELIDSE